MSVEGAVHIHFVSDGSGHQIDLMVGSRLELVQAAIAYLENLIRLEIGELPDLVDEVDVIGGLEDDTRP